MKGVARLAIILTIMAKQTKKSQVANKYPDTKICTDVKVWLNEPGLKRNKAYRGTFTYHNANHSTFIEDDVKQSKPHVIHPELHWRDLVGSLHGKVRINANGVLLQMYIRHDDYQNANELCDIFESEIEQMDEQLSGMDLKEEVSRCG